MCLVISTLNINVLFIVLLYYCIYLFLVGGGEVLSRIMELLIAIDETCTISKLSPFSLKVLTDHMAVTIDRMQHGD